MQKDLTKVNYQRVLDGTLKQITENGKTPSLLLRAVFQLCLGIFVKIL